MKMFKAMWSQIQRSRTLSIITQREPTGEESVERRHTKAETLEGWDHTTAERPGFPVPFLVNMFSLK